LKYTRWEEFIDYYKKPLEALKDIYNPPFFVRIGLRYIDIFNRSELDLKDTSWTELIQPYILGILSSDVADRVKAYENKQDILLSDNSSILHMTNSLVQKLPENETCFIIDSDFSNSRRTSFDEIYDKMNFLNANASKMIRWAIKDKLHNAMNPQKI
jgi:uncharacterized protein (TIGR04255 family)